MQTALLLRLCSLPTAPFAEQFVIEFVRRWCAQRPALKLAEDSAGNLLLELRGSKPSRSRWIFTAHMDHPGCVAERMVDARTLHASFRGGVRDEFVLGAKVRFFTSSGEVPGKIVKLVEISSERPHAPAAVHVRVGQPVERGSPGMFDVAGGRIQGKRFLSRACDDLAGAAACLTMLDALVKKPPAATVGVLLTRGEEEAFIGAIAAARSGTLIRKSDRLIAIECSSAQPYAPMGGGVILRVGDRTSIFNSSLSYFVATQADALAAKNRSFRYQRALMPGGSCEATAYDAFGYTAASLCVPMANYHNMDMQHMRIAPEMIDVNDWQSMTRLFVHLARTAHLYKPGHQQLKLKLTQRYKRWQPMLKQLGSGK